MIEVVVVKGQCGEHYFCRRSGVFRRFDNMTAVAKEFGKIDKLDYVDLNWFSGSKFGDYLQEQLFTNPSSWNSSLLQSVGDVFKNLNLNNS